MHLGWLNEPRWAGAADEGMSLSLAYWESVFQGTAFRQEGGVRVLFWAESFLPDLGGVQVFAGHLLPHLKETYGHEFCVVCCTGAGVSTSEQWAGIPVNRFPFHSALLSRNLKLVADLRRAVDRLFRDVQPDLIHVNTTGPSLFFLQGHLRQPCLTTMHELILARDRNSVLGRLLISSRLTVTVSQSILNDLRGFLPEVSKRAKVVYCGLPSFSLEPTPLPFGPPQFLCLGRLAEQKGFDLAIRALPSIANSVPSVQLLVVGDGEQRQELGQLAQDLNVSERVKFEGWVDPAMIFQYMDKATLVIVPSRAREGLPLVALQAAQRGRPVVAAGVGGLAEVVLHGETGLLFEAERIDRLATAVIELLTNSLLCSEMGSRAAESVRCRFSLSTHLESYEKVYLSALEAAKGN